MPAASPQRLLFVCLGNICRSPLAECLFRHHATQRGVADRFALDSAGTGGWHAGDRPDPRMRRVAARHGITVDGAARQVRAADFGSFDLLVCMDRSNRADLERLGAPAERLCLLLEQDPAARGLRDVPDPYHDDEDGFETVFGLVDRACVALLDARLAGERGAGAR